MRTLTASWTPLQPSQPEPRAFSKLLLLDNDLFLILAATGCFEGTAQLFGLSIGELRRLNSLAGALRNAKFAPDLPQYVRDAALRYCGQVQPISSQHDPAILDRLTAHRDIGDGEAQLLAHALQEPATLLGTNDKRFLRALCAAPVLADMRAAVTGRIVCLESLIRMHLDAKGVTAAAAKFSAADYDGTVHLIFNAGANTAEQHCRDGLRSFLADLEASLGAGFLYSAGAA